MRLYRFVSRYEPFTENFAGGYIHCPLDSVPPLVTRISTSIKSTMNGLAELRVDSLYDSVLLRDS
jgi:hypothetical protein